jgi:hypothetical protein
VGFSKVLNFSTSAACPENVYNYGNKEQCVGHVPIEHSKVFKFFLKTGGKIFATVIGSRLIYIRDNLE